MQVLPGDETGWRKLAGRIDAKIRALKIKIREEKTPLRSIGSKGTAGRAARRESSTISWWLSANMRDFV
ncbi:MAG: hypothetical protein ACLR8Y_04165 [Alistipes indistinctus]